MAHRLSLQRIEAAAREIAPVFRDTPQFVSEPLGAELGCTLTLKVETLNPIRSFKGRGASYFVGQLPASSRPLVCASAGNFGQALAYACRTAGRTLVVYAAENANALKVARMRALGAEVRLQGEDFDAAKDAASAFAATGAAQLVVDGLEPAIAEGAGTIGRELLAFGRALRRDDGPARHGALLTGLGRWVKAHAPETELVGVVSAGAPAMAAAFEGEVEDARRARAHTVADGIAVRVPIPEAVADMRGLVDRVVRVSDEDILAAMRLLHRHVGLVVEPAGAAGVAALLPEPERYRGRSVATVLCGGNLTPEQMASWL